MSTCRSCGAEIFWAQTTNGRYMPVDAEPDPDGNVVLTGTVRAEQGASVLPEVRVEPGHPMFDEATERFVAHFVTCPNADEWRTR